MSDGEPHLTIKQLKGMMAELSKTYKK